MSDTWFSQNVQLVDYRPRSKLLYVPIYLTWCTYRLIKFPQNVDRENSNKVKQEEGALAVARIKAQALNTKADAEAYSIVAAAKAQAQRTRIEAEAQAEATRLAAEAEAGAVRIKAQADVQVVDQFAREMEFRRMEVTRVKAYGSKTIFVPVDGPGAQMGNAMAMGMAAGMGADSRRAAA